MKLSRLTGLFLLSLLLSALWLSTSYGAEDPWDENKVASDSGNALSDPSAHYHRSPACDADGARIIVIPGAPWCTKVLNAPFTVLSNAGLFDFRKGAVQHSSTVKAEKLRIESPEGDKTKTKQ